MDRETQQEVTNQITALIGRLTLENVSLTVRLARLEAERSRKPADPMGGDPDRHGENSEV